MSCAPKMFSKCKIRTYRYLVSVWTSWKTSIPWKILSWLLPPTTLSNCRNISPYLVSRSDCLSQLPRQLYRPSCYRRQTSTKSLLHGTQKVFWTFPSIRFLQLSAFVNDFNRFTIMREVRTLYFVPPWDTARHRNYTLPKLANAGIEAR